MLFNLIPLAPLDGDKIIEYFFPPKLANAWANIRPYGPIILMAIVFLGPLLGVDVLGIIMNQPLYSLFYLLVGA